MSGNPIIIERNSEGSVSSSLKKGMKSESHSFPSISGDSKLEIVILSDDLEMDGLPEEYLSDEIRFTSTSESLFPIKYMGVKNFSRGLCLPQF